jgi:hypothetical protein
MFNIFSHQEHANQNNTEILLYTSQNCYHQENEQQMLVREWEGRPLMYCWWECKPGQPVWKSYGNS